ncbi:MAG: D-amino acid aminotransferase [Betaproteobacteria bacterium]|nr:D-amino acid aminotransferase [Betaproteobacteria bacterium]MBI2508934.1 D-amino acid aminotransferase [Betaproteobacteria bacterium]
MSTSETVYLNGEFMPLENARVPVLDRGFIFGDGVYEVIPVYSRRPFRLPEHCRRLQRSLDAVRIANPMTDAEWARLVGELVARNADEDQYIYLQVTRGVAKRDHAFPRDAKPTVFVMSSPLATPARELVENGVPCVTAVDFRWLKCDVKSVSLLGNCLLRQAAADAGAAETVLFRDGWLTEASASNVFVVKGGRLLAPPKNHLMLPGITYDVVLELAAAKNIPAEVREIAEREVRDADELWLTSSTREVLAITTLDGRPVGGGRPGAVFKTVYQAYQEFKRKVMRQAA